MAVQLHSPADQPPNPFAHAYYSHREVFKQAEAESSLYAHFLALTSKFDLVPAEFLVIFSNQYCGEGEKVHARNAHEHYLPPSQLIARTNLLPKSSQQHQPGLLRARSPLAPTPSDSDSSSMTNGGIGEHPTIGHSSHSR